MISDAQNLHSLRVCHRCSLTKSCPTLRPHGLPGPAGFLSLTISRSFRKLMLSICTPYIKSNPVFYLLKVIYLFVATPFPQLTGPQFLDQPSNLRPWQARAPALTADSQGVTERKNQLHNDTLKHLGSSLCKWKLETKKAQEEACSFIKHQLNTKFRGRKPTA